MSKTLEELFKDVITEPQHEFDWGEKEYLEKLEKEIELLKRENKALADDNEMKCELNDKLSKTLDKACNIISNIYDLPDIRWTFSADEWKEYLLNDIS